MDGVTAYTPAELRGIFADRLGQEVTLSEAFKIAQDVEAFYRGDGYVLSRVIVPIQTIENGVMRIQVIEGYIDSITYVGEIGESIQVIEGYLNKLVAIRPINIADLERYLLLSNDVPGITVRGVLQPSNDAQGAAQLVVTLDRKIFDGFARVDNRESEFNGPWQGIAGIASNSLTPIGERMEIIGLAALDVPERRYIGFNMDGRFGSEGLVVRGLCQLLRQRSRLHLGASGRRERHLSVRPRGRLSAGALAAHEFLARRRI